MSSILPAASGSSGNIAVPESALSQRVRNDKGAEMVEDFVGATLGIAKTAASLASGVGPALGMGTLGGFGVTDPMQLLHMQYAIQQETQAFTTASNITKAHHDANMSAVRNLRS